MNIIVKGNELEWGGKQYKCAVGKNGFSSNKKEGDNCSPIGTFPIREVFYRPDKITKPNTPLKCTALSPDDGWCDAPSDVNYNKFVKLPYPASHEKLWRDDNLYDIIVIIGYNDNPIISGKGSAIFMHIAKPEYAGTEGCIALKIDDLVELLQTATIDSKISISP